MIKPIIRIWNVIYHLLKKKNFGQSLKNYIYSETPIYCYHIHHFLAMIILFLWSLHKLYLNNVNKTCMHRSSKSWFPTFTIVKLFSSLKLNWWSSESIWHTNWNSFFCPEITHSCCFRGAKRRIVLKLWHVCACK